ncbi:MAG: creatininase family protein [Candidatus Coatesbacteria bacterium]|nr:MAG: creatininase family protein [Candidatus Coatesbacteria bacterium]
MRLDHALGPDVAEYLKKENRLFLPAGSVEQHGPAVATGIDYLIAEAVATEAAERLDVYCAPPLCYGMSLHHASFPGTASVRPSVYLPLVVDLLTFFVDQGFSKIVVVNGHGGNLPSLTAAAGEVAYDRPGVRLKIQNWYQGEAVAARLAEAFADREGSHATPGETSVLMYLRPELVGEVGAVEYAEPGRITWVPGPGDLREHYPQGAIGADPSLASAEIGAELFELAVEGVMEAMAAL